jgi:molybdate transport system ATP-binding protein
VSKSFSVTVSREIEGFRLEVDFTAANGITAIVGPSGAGKSMLLNTIAGLTHPENGKIALNGLTLFDKSSNINLAPEYRGLGVVFQDARLFPHMSVQANLTFAKRTERAAIATFEEVVDLLDLSSLLTRRPHHLSGGEKQRVAIGRALLSAPAALVMDEPLANLDLARRREIMPFLERIRNKFSLPILYVSHNLDETIRLANHVIVMDQGKIVARGAVEDVLSRIDVQSLILGNGDQFTSPEPVTIASATIGELHKDGLVSIHTPWGILTAPNVAGDVGDTVHLRVRARDIVLSSMPPHALSIRNVIAGDVGTMTDAGTAQIDVLIRPHAHDKSNAKPLWARITRRAATEMKLKPGMPVWALLKAVVLANDIDLDGVQ